MKMRFKKIVCDKYIFLKLYIIISIIMIIYRLVYAIVDEEVILDNLCTNLQKYFFGSLFYVKYYLMVSFESVSPIAILLVFHFGLLVEEKICEIVKNNIVSIIFMPIMGIIFYIVFKLKLECTLPFSLLEGIAFATIIYPIDKIFNIRGKICD